jgi:small-conductance mechanosensitive channel
LRLASRFKTYCQNFLAGLHLLWAQPFRVGDEIKLDAYEGTVEEIQARATIIKTYDERRVVIPNADLFTHAVIVNTALGSRRWQYDHEVKKVPDLQALKIAILSAIRRVPGVLAEPPAEALVGCDARHGEDQDLVVDQGFPPASNACVVRPSTDNSHESCRQLRKRAEAKIRRLAGHASSLHN